MSATVESEVKVGDGFFLFPGYSRARGAVVEVTSPLDNTPVIARLSLKGIDLDNVYHLKRSETVGLDGEVLFDASIDYVRDALARNWQGDWE